MWILPNKNLLSKSTSNNEAEDMEVAAREGAIIEEKTDELGARLNVEEIHLGPQVISFLCGPAQGVLARSLPRLEKDLQLELGSQSIAIHAPSPGTKFVCVEIPNLSRRTIMLGNII